MHAAPDTASAIDTQGKPAFSIQRIYLKDFSLEQPNSPEIFLEQAQPSSEVRLQIDSQKLNDAGVYEVVLTANVTTKVNDKILFIVEAHQAGIFDILHLPEEQIPAVLGVTCPHILFPYVRVQISDMVVRAGFAPVYLQELNFQAMFEQSREQAQA